MSRPANTSQVARRVLAELRSRGWLLQADAVLPNVAALVAGEPIRGSWWSHPKSNLVYWVLEELEDSPEVLRVKLVRGKATMLHRALWPALVAAGAARARWQTAGLSRSGRSLHLRTERAETLRLDRLERWSGPAKPGDAARELEARLLVYAHEIHTETGKHTKELETWRHFAERLGVSAPLPDPDDAKHALECAVVGEKLLPWQ